MTIDAYNYHSIAISMFFVDLYIIVLASLFKYMSSHEKAREHRNSSSSYFDPESLTELVGHWFCFSLVLVFVTRLISYHHQCSCSHGIFTQNWGYTDIWPSLAFYFILRIWTLKLSTNSFIYWPVSQTSSFIVCTICFPFCFCQSQLFESTHVHQYSIK